MPSDQRQSPDQSAPKGWRLEPCPGREVHTDVHGQICVPMWISRDDEHVADAEMVLLPAEARLMSDRLTMAVGGARSIMQELFPESAIAASGRGVTLISKLPDMA
ncbi:MAG TPA: hypothetical protein VIP77_24125 [Jiangellaceae bacterium]